MLFDVDGTLIASGSPVQITSYGRAIHAVYGVEAHLHEIDPHGKLDRQIFAELLAHHGIEPPRTPEAREELFQARYRYLAQNLQDGRQEEILPGVHDLLAALKGRFILGVLTGNETRSGWLRLERAGLKHYFSLGAFGDESDRRADLVRIAMERASAQAGRPLRADEVVVVGDTLRDIACARDNGAPVIAVASGKTGAPALQAAGADLVLQDLTQTEAFERFVDPR